MLTLTPPAQLSPSHCHPLSVLNMILSDQVQENLKSTHTYMQTAGPSFASNDVYDIYYSL